MKLFHKSAIALVLGLGISAITHADNKGSKIDYEDDKALYQGLDSEYKKVAPIYQLLETRSTKVVACVLNRSGCGPSVAPAPVDPIASYEAPFPHKTQPTISAGEKALLVAYLNDSKNVGLATYLAIYHLQGVLLDGTINSGNELKHVIWSSYFLNRIQDLGHNDLWVRLAINKLDKKLAKLNQKYQGIKLDENHPAQLYFNDTFFDHEENRYIAADKLLDDYVQSPNNVYTSFLNVAVNNWIAGEANYDDPTYLYNFLISGYFSFRTMDLSQIAERAWNVDPVNNKRFRLASIVGGFSAMQRRTMSIIHHDPVAKIAIDNEHREWRLINKAFHAFSVGLSFFGEEDNFLEGYAAWEEAFSEGIAHPDLITILDRPRYTFNLEGMFVGYADFELKLGNIPQAYQYLTIAQNYMPNSAYWDYGRDALQHRFQNAGEIAARYANDNPNDDPAPFMVKRHKWGGDDSVCQVCHQRQSKVWTQQEKDTVLLAPDDILTVGTWPQKRTTWYGAIKNL